MRKVNVVEFVSYKPQSGQRKIPVAASRMAGGQVHIPTLFFQRP
jgi:hypothetical protein